MECVECDTHGTPVCWCPIIQRGVLDKNVAQSLASSNMSNVSKMSGMFQGANSFNQPLNKWNVSNVTEMTGMFQGIESFNQSLDSWNLSDDIYTDLFEGY